MPDLHIVRKDRPHPNQSQRPTHPDVALFDSSDDDQMPRSFIFHADLYKATGDHACGTRTSFDDALDFVLENIGLFYLRELSTTCSIIMKDGIAVGSISALPLLQIESGHCSQRGIR